MLFLWQIIHVNISTACIIITSDHRCYLIYGNGLLCTQIAAMGRVALIADSLAEASVAAVIRGNMKKQLQPWLTGINSNPLRYDTTYGGITTTNGLADGAHYTMLVFPSSVGYVRMMGIIVLSFKINVKSPSPRGHDDMMTKERTVREYGKPLETLSRGLLISVSMFTHSPVVTCFDLPSRTERSSSSDCLRMSLCTRLKVMVAVMMLQAAQTLDLACTMTTTSIGGTSFTQLQLSDVRIQLGSKRTRSALGQVLSTWFAKIAGYGAVRTDLSVPNSATTV